MLLLWVLRTQYYPLYYSYHSQGLACNALEMPCVPFMQHCLIGWLLTDVILLYDSFCWLHPISCLEIDGHPISCLEIDGQESEMLCSLINMFAWAIVCTRPPDPKHSYLLYLLSSLYFHLLAISHMGPYHCWGTNWFDSFIIEFSE